MRTLAIVVLLAGCNSILGIQDLHASHGAIDAPKADGIDTPPGTPTFTGTVTHAVDGSPIANASVSFYLDSGDLVSSAVTDANGAYGVAITAALPVDGYFQVTAPGELATYSHLMFPTSDDPATTIPMYARGELDALSASTSCPVTTQGGLVVFRVFDAAANPVTGATIETSVTTGIGYTDPATTLPSCSGNVTATDADGAAFVFSQTAGNIIVTAKDSGGTQFAQTNFLLVVDTVVIAPLRP